MATEYEEEVCSKTKDGKHVPDWNSVHVDFDGGEIYIDIQCKNCGLSGCLGTEKTLVEGLSW